ncbi:Cupin domain-containing protein [Modicisalibacter muralis]|uniref:Cupin domain-containing protein n=1 Tax=Modicisalibacter muralis TaxID=119000 RepID=A0A1G9M4W5_9GAMM|nr:cupin domain-containing protein [Halomonas muralis]SDL69238.1 Cupin domain-containing protein [Halomonas muralis]
MTHRLTPSNALQRLQANDGTPFLELFRHGSLQVEIYKPEGVDRQAPHTRDEVYVIISGSGQFLNGSTRQPFQPGEVLFVPAGVEHRFEDFTKDFATWVFFYGPEGGESTNAHSSFGEAMNP